jgi:MarR family transcriptional regulator, organic hydroperoxide resistance regulator
MMHGSHYVCQAKAMQFLTKFLQIFLTNYCICNDIVFMEIPIDYREYRIQDAFCSLAGGVTYMLHQRLLKNFQQAGHDVTYEQWNVLIQLWSQDGRSQQELAACTTKNQSYMTRLIDAMEERDWVRRTDDSTDRRVKLVYLTAAGRELTKALIELSQKTLGEALAEIDADQVAVCRQVLQAMMANLTRS